MQSLKTLNKQYLSLPFLVRLPIALTILTAFLIVIQNPLIFPGAVISLFSTADRTASILPAGVSSKYIPTSDGKRLELWKLGTNAQKPVAVIFHGNGGDIENFFPYQQYFSSIGITSYAFDYRGYGTSTGWPSERGLEIDTDAVLREILAAEQIDAKDLIVVGVSVGSGPASYAAAKYSPRMLILFSPFISLPDAIRSRPIVGLLSRFSFYSFPVAANVSRLKDTCVVVAHGDEDNVIPYNQGRVVYEHAKVPFARFISAKNASHNDVLFKAHSQLTPIIRECINAT